MPLQSIVRHTSLSVKRLSLNKIVTNRHVKFPLKFPESFISKTCKRCNSLSFATSVKAYILHDMRRMHD